MRNVEEKGSKDGGEEIGTHQQVHDVVCMYAQRKVYKLITTGKDVRSSY
jgi:hypothetical protein